MTVGPGDTCDRAGCWRPSHYPRVVDIGSADTTGDTAGEIAARRAAVERLGILDTPRERAYDDIAMLAARICQAPAAFISFFDEDRQWFKAKIGIDVDSVPREHSIGAYAIRSNGPFVVRDTATDERFADWSFDVPTRSYAGFALYDLGRVAVGVLGVVHRTPQPFLESQLEMLAALARQVEQLFVLRATMVALARDQDQLFVREQRFRSVLQALAQGALVYDINGILLDCNPAAESILGSSRADLFGRRADERYLGAMHEDGTPYGTEERPINVTLRHGIEVRDEVMGISRASDGARRWLLVNAAPLWGPGNRITGAITTFADVTELFTLKNQLQASFDDLARAAQERAALLSAVSHDIRAPLAAIRMMTEILEDRADAISEWQRTELISRVHAEARRTEGVLSDLVAANRLGSGLEAPRRTRVDLEQLIYDSARERAGATHSITVDTVRGNLTLWADEVQLERIVDNLISNAITHTPAGCNILISAVGKADVIELSVDDDGPGVPEEMRVSVFGAYVRGERSADRPGTGLGLFLVQQFAGFHGGAARCMRSARGGARFLVTLPRQPGTQAFGKDASPPSR